ncbi:MAG: DUF2798 domain-containing protein [Burkholderiales bacterium]|nr:DUF2798 domain-containing protein [Burkholderiales bacterium]
MLDAAAGAWNVRSRLEARMSGPAKYIFPILMSGVMAFLMTALVTALNLGFPSDFMHRWAIAFVIAWPCAALAAFIAIPLARRGTAAILRVFEGHRA